MVNERQFIRHEVDFRTHRRQIGLVRCEARGDDSSTRQRIDSAHGVQPVAHLRDQDLDLAVMGGDVLPGNVRKELLIAKRCAPRKMPSSSGMLKRGSWEWASISVREISWIPKRQPAISLKIFSMRTWPES